jgi:hypothetical protein
MNSSKNIDCENQIPTDIQNLLNKIKQENNETSFQTTNMKLWIVSISTIVLVILITIFLVYNWKDDI